MLSYLQRYRRWRGGRWRRIGAPIVRARWARVPDAMPARVDEDWRPRRWDARTMPEAQLLATKVLVAGPDGVTRLVPTVSLEPRGPVMRLERPFEVERARGGLAMLAIARMPAAFAAGLIAGGGFGVYQGCLTVFEAVRTRDVLILEASTPRADAPAPPSAPAPSVVPPAPVCHVPAGVVRHLGPEGCGGPAFYAADVPAVGHIVDPVLLDGRRPIATQPVHCGTCGRPLAFVHPSWLEVVHGDSVPGVRHAS